MRYLARTAIALTLSTSSTLFAQSLTQPAPNHPFALDVASIKPNHSGSQNGGGGFFPPGSLRIINMPLEEVIRQAYLPPYKGYQLLGAPAWMQNERYDFVGRIDEASAPAWLKLNLRQQVELGRPLLQKLLADRCKLVAHFVSTQIDGYNLLVGKHGAHLTPSKPGESYPDGVKNLDFDGGKIIMSFQPTGAVQFFNATIQELANTLGGPFGSVIQDQTNLTGRYNFTIHRKEITKDLDGNPTITNPQPSDQWDISDTGLELKPAKVPSQNLVIDHIERPTPN